MTSIQVSDIAVFMKYFLSTDTFDFLNAVEITISTFCDFKIDGRHNKNYFDSDNVPEDEFTAWGKVRPICHELIKGKTLPLKMTFILMVPKEQSVKLLEANGLAANASNIDLLVNVRYENGQVNLISATSCHTFIPDKSYDRLWDEVFSEKVAGYNF